MYEHGVQVIRVLGDHYGGSGVFTCVAFLLAGVAQGVAVVKLGIAKYIENQFDRTS